MTLDQQVHNLELRVRALELELKTTKENFEKLVKFLDHVNIDIKQGKIKTTGYL